MEHSAPRPASSSHANRPEGLPEDGKRAGSGSSKKRKPAGKTKQQHKKHGRDGSSGARSTGFS